MKGPLLLLLAASTVGTTPPEASAPAAGSGSAGGAAADRTHLLHALVVEEGETVGDALCLGCGIVVRGRVLGDAVAVLGGVDVEGEAGRSSGDDVIAIGGAVHVGPWARVPASMLALGGPVRIDPGATASYDVDSLALLQVPGQRQLFVDGTVCLVAFVLTLVGAGGVLVRTRGIVARDLALAEAPVRRGLVGAAFVLVLLGVMGGGERLGRFAGVTQTAFGFAFLAATAVGSTGVASLLGRGLARLAGRRLRAGWRAFALGGAALALLLLVPLLGLVVAVPALCLAVGGATARRDTLDASSSGEVAP
jgi:hypothetical protein